MNRSVSENTPVRTSSDVMSAVVGEVEAALRALERERNTESVSTSRKLFCRVRHLIELRCNVSLALSSISPLLQLFRVRSNDEDPSAFMSIRCVPQESTQALSFSSLQSL
jgi:hypothetical protein